MNLSIEEFFSITTDIAQRKIPVPKLSIETDDASSYSDLLKLTCNPEVLKDDRLAKLTFIASSMIGLNPVQEEEWKTRLAKIADKWRSQGKWKDLIELIYEVPFTPYDQLNWLFNQVGPHAFFGTELVSIKRLYNSFKFINPYVPNTSPVKRSKRKRGYDDKGHLSKSRFGHKNTVRAEPRPDKEKTFNPIVPITESLFYDDLTIKLFDKFRLAWLCN